MTTSTTQLLADLKQSPAKAAVLAVGAIIAGIVWVPRLAGAFSAPSGAAPGAPVAAPQSEVVHRDPAVLKAEFARVTRDAKALRAFVAAVDLPPTRIDPFARDVPVPDAAPPAPQPVAPADTEAEDEAKRAAALRLQGVFQFPRGPVVVIDGQRIGAGGRIDEFDLVAVEGRTCTVRGLHGRYVLRLDEERKP